MSIKSQIERIQSNVTASLAAVAAKGVTVASDSTSDDLPSLISSISTQSSGTTVSTSTPRNLLDNSNFANPVNQRGQTTYTDSNGSGTYSIDRWMTTGTVSQASTDSSGATVALATKYIEANNNIFAQVYFADAFDLADKMTVAACDIDGNIYCVTADLFAFDTVFDDGYHVGIAPLLGIDSDNFKCYGVAALSAGSWLWAAVYAGEYTVDTLPEYVPKGYTAELLECQRYYYRVPSTSAMGYPGYASSTTQARITVQTPVPMRTTPTVTMEAISQARIFDSSGAKTPTAVSVMETDGNGVALAFTTSYLTAWTTCSARFNTTVELDAEIYM